MNRGNAIDAAERIFWTFAQAFLAVLIASPVFDSLGLGWQDALKIALFAGLLSAAKVLLALATSRNAQLGAQTYDNTETGEVVP